MPDWDDATETRYEEHQARAGGFVCSPSDLHPYECDGAGQCIHCDRTITPTHAPGRCELCTS